MKKLIFILFVGVFGLLLSIQPTYALELDPNLNFEGKKVTFLGDSLTAGTAIEETDRWTYLVANELGFSEYVNMGINGSRVTQESDKTDSFEERVSQIPTDSDYVFIMGGWNDKVSNILIADFEIALQSVVDYIRTNIPNAQIVLMTYFDLGDVTTNTETKTLADFYGVFNTVSDDRIVVGEPKLTGKIQLLDLYNIADIQPEEVELYTYDDLHPNEAGSRLLANMIISFLAGENIDESSSYSVGRIGATGVIVSEDYRYTEAIPVTAGRSYVIYNNNSSTSDQYYMFAPGIFTDVDGEYISEIPVKYNTMSVVTAPETATHMIVNFNQTKIDSFYVRQIINEFQLDYVTNGAEESIDSVLVKNATVVEPEEPTRDNYIFAGWYTDDSFINLYDFDDVVNDNITLYAKWITDTSDGSSVIVPEDDTLTILGVSWYWWIAGFAVLYFGFTKNGRKALGLKK